MKGFENKQALSTTWSRFYQDNRNLFSFLNLVIYFLFSGKPCSPHQSVRASPLALTEDRRCLFFWMPALSLQGSNWPSWSAVNQSQGLSEENSLSGLAQPHAQSSESPNHTPSEWGKWFTPRYCEGRKHVPWQFLLPLSSFLLPLPKHKPSQGRIE